MASTTTTICAFCHVAVDLDESTACESCGTRHHTDCWDQNEGCAVPLCEGGPKLPYIAPAVGDIPDANGGRRRIIELDPDGEPAPRPAFAPVRARRWTPWRVAGVILIAAAVAACVVIATRGPATPTTAAGSAPVAAPSTAEPKAAPARPLPALTARRIAREKARVKRFVHNLPKRPKQAPVVVSQQPSPQTPAPQPQTPSAPQYNPTAPTPRYQPPAKKPSGGTQRSTEPSTPVLVNVG